MMDRTSMPALSVAIPEFQIRLTGAFGRRIPFVRLKISAGSIPSSREGANSQIRKGELSPWLNCR